MFSDLAQIRLEALRAGSNAGPLSAGRPAGGVGSPASGGAPFGGAAGVDAPRRPGVVFRDCPECPEMVVLTGGGLAMGRYEVTVGEYRAFASAAGGGAGGGCLRSGGSWRDPGFPQTDRHPVTCVSWEDAQEYVSWLSRRTGASYRLPTEAEWERAASGSQPGCYRDPGQWNGTGWDGEGTCPVDSYVTNAAGLSGMLGNASEWMSDCWEGGCDNRRIRGGSWADFDFMLRVGGEYESSIGGTAQRSRLRGFRVSRTPD